MTQIKGNKLNFDDIIERYRWWIGAILLSLVLISGGYLLWKDNGQKDGSESFSDSVAEELSQKINGQNTKIAELEGEISNLEKNSQAPIDAKTSGEVAGASTIPQTSETKTTISGKVNLNSATNSELDSLPGIGEAYAARIIEYRTSHGGFKSIEEIKNVKGIGDKTFEKLKDLITV